LINIVFLPTYTTTNTDSIFQQAYPSICPRKLSLKGNLSSPGSEQRPLNVYSAYCFDNNLTKHVILKKWCLRKCSSSFIIMRERERVCVCMFVCMHIYVIKMVLALQASVKWVTVRTNFSQDTSTHVPNFQSSPNKRSTKLESVSDFFQTYNKCMFQYKNLTNFSFSELAVSQHCFT
jgi:hypothetical protein